MRSAAAAIMMALAALASAQLNAVEIVQKIAPDAKCNDTKPATECRTAQQAAPFLAKAFEDYKIFSVNVMAAVISLMAFESVNFKFKHNVFPGRPGQGTANMQMANFNLMYAQSIDDVKDKIGDVKSVEGASNETLNHILNLVTDDKHNFGSGPWFFMTQCKQPDTTDALVKDPDAGFEAYMKCVGVTVTDDRKAYFTRAKAAFGLTSS